MAVLSHAALFPDGIILGKNLPPKPGPGQLWISEARADLARGRAG